jgi:hypothetical protein
MSERIKDDDRAHAVAFVDGAMSGDERSRFELRLAAEPELAAAVEELMRTDELLRRSIARRIGDGRVISFAERKRRSKWIWPASLAAAVLVAFGLFRWLGEERTPRGDCLVALAPSFATPEEFVASRPELAGLKPPGLGSLRGPSEETNVGAKEFVERARASEEKPSAPASSAVPISAGYFVVPVDAKTSSSIVVLGFPKSGASARLFPEASDARPASERGRLEPGLHTLPRERIELAGDDRTPSVKYNRGFLVPIGAREMSVLVATRHEPLGESLLAAIDEALKRGESRDALKRRLEERGFAVTELTVLEPRN